MVKYSRNSNLADSLGGITFGVDDDGNYGYKKAGADTVTPFKNAEAILSNVIFNCINSQNTIWGSTGTGVTIAKYEVPNDGTLKLICKYNYYRTANQNTANGNKQWHAIFINDKQILSTLSGDIVLIEPLTFDVKKGDVVEYRWYIQWTSGDAIYAVTVAILASLFFQK